MGIVTFLASLFFLLFNVLKNRDKLLNPFTLFYLLWTFILFLSVINLYDIYKPTDEAYFLILIMLIAFFIGNLISKKVSLKQITSDIKECCEPKFLIIYILFGMLILFTIIDCVIVIQNLNDGVPMYTIRRWRMGTFGVDNNPILSRRTFAEEIFRSVILTPFETLVPPITAYCFFNPKKYKNRCLLLILSIIVLILSSLAGGGGRLGFIYYFGSFLLAFILFSKSNFSGFDKEKYKKYIIIFMICGIVAVFAYTQLRTSAGFIKQLYTYFALPPTLLSIWIPKLENVTHTYGLLTTFGVHSYFFRGLQTIGLDSLVPSLYTDAFQHLLNAEKFYQVGYGVGNAFVTPIYYFYIDGGYIFVFIASVVFGFVVSLIYKKILNSINLKNFTYYTLIMYGVFLTFIRIQTSIPAYIISFVMAYFILSPYKKKNENIKPIV